MFSKFIAFEKNLKNDPEYENALKNFNVYYFFHMNQRNTIAKKIKDE